MLNVMLTTEDNPYNPYHDFDLWYAYDMEKGYGTCQYLARITRSADELSWQDQEQAVLDAINEILHYNINGLYKTITKDDVIDRVTHDDLE